MSLRKEFLEAKRKPGDRIPYGYEDVNRALAKFAEQLPGDIAALIKRIDMGETIYESLEPSLKLEVTFSNVYSWTQPDKERLEKIPGYRLLLNTCASPDVDVCCVIQVAQKDNHSSMGVFRVSIAPGEAFEKSQLRISFGKSQGQFEIGKEDWVPRLDKPKLRVAAHRAE